MRNTIRPLFILDVYVYRRTRSAFQSFIVWISRNPFRFGRSFSSLGQGHYPWNLISVKPIANHLTPLLREGCFEGSAVTMNNLEIRNRNILERAVHLLYGDRSLTPFPHLSIKATRNKTVCPWTSRGFLFVPIDSPLSSAWCPLLRLAQKIWLRRELRELLYAPDTDARSNGGGKSTDCNG